MATLKDTTINSSGTVSGSVTFNDDTNTYGQVLRAQPSASAQTNVILLPTGTGTTETPDVVASETYAKSKSIAFTIVFG